MTQKLFIPPAFVLRRT